MSRKPPKLVPIPGKTSAATPTETTMSESMPPLKQGVVNLNANKNSGSDTGNTAPPSLRKSGLTRHFLNCNGSTARSKGRLSSSKLSSPSNSSPSSSKTPLNSSLSSVPLSTKGNGKVSNTPATTTTTNGCGSEEQLPIMPPLLTKVNGTISKSNGLTTTTQKPNDTCGKQMKRRKSLNGGEDEDEHQHHANDLDEEIESSSSTSDSQQSSGIVFTNGRKNENSNSSDNNTCTSVVSTNNIQNSQKLNVNVVNSSSSSITKRTSRFSQNSRLSNSKVFTSRTTPASCLSSRSSSPSIVEENSMPALIAFDSSSSSTIKEDAPLAPPSHLPPDNLDYISDDNNQSTTEESISEEPKIIRKGDTVIKSYVDEKTGKISVFEKEMKLEVCDFGSGKWYPAKVKSIDWGEQNILVHYSNWSSRYDEWISMTSNRVRPSEDTNVVSVQFAVGDRVEAIWSIDSKKYLASVTQALNQDMYEVLFDDGIRMKRSANQLSKVTSADQLAPTSFPQRPPAPFPELDTDSPSQKEEVKPRNSRMIRPRRSIKNSIVSSREPDEHIPPEAEEPPAPNIELMPLDSDGTMTPNNRPAHFSMFDLPKGDLGKRKRKVHDYSVLVKGRTPPVLKGPRRPKSEGSAVLLEENNLTHLSSSVPDEEDDERSTVEETPAPIQEDLEKEKEETLDTPVDSPIPPPPPAPSRRRKSAAVTRVPTVKPSIESPKELPADVEDSTPKTTPPPAEPVKIPKRRKHATPHVSSTTTAAKSNATAVGDNNTLLKSDTAQISSDLAIAVSSSVGAPSSRRAKSLGTTPLPSISPAVHTEVPKDAVDSGFADESGNPIIIQVNSDDGFWKCPLNNCGKNFRKDSLLKMHLKHYHPELTVTRGIANVVQMAQARTAFENEHPSDHHPVQKLHSIDATAENSTVVDPEPISVVEDAPSPHKRTNKTVSLPKESPEKSTSTTSHKVETDIAKSTPDSGKQETPQDSSATALTQIPRLRVNRKRKFIIAKLSRVRASKKTIPPPTTVSPQTKSREASPKSAIVTDGSPNKKSKLSEINYVAQTEVENTDTITTGPLKTPSPSKSDRRSDQLVEKNCPVSAVSEPFLFPPFYEPETLPFENSRSSREPWSKSHIRRSLLNSNRRRVGPNKSATATSIFLKRRMQMRKYKRTRQKRASVLNRVSSGRMRVISKSLNQRSMKRKRLRATRRFRDVKVDVINCICNNKTEFGLMIQCEFCFCWQHGSCFNVQSNSQLPDYYACQSCSEPDRPSRSLPYEWAQSEYYRLGKLPSFSFGPAFPKEDAWTIKRCNKLTSKIGEVHSMIQNLQVNERICFGYPELSQMYQWNTERLPPDELVQKERFQKYFKPVLRRLLVENKSDHAYNQKLKKIAEARLKLKKYSDSVESAKLAMKKKLGCRNATYVHYICDSVFTEMMKAARKSNAEDSTGATKETVDYRKKPKAENAFQRLSKFREEIIKTQSKEVANVGLLNEGSFPFPGANTVEASTSKNSSFTSSSLLTNGVSSTPSNGLKKGLTTSVRDAALLSTYLKETRTLEDNISSTITRISKLFPEDWKNLMRISREFVKDAGKDTLHNEKFKWISQVIQTYNTLRILLKHIYSESNEQKQRIIISSFEKASIKLFDLFGIGVAEERISKKSRLYKHQSKKIRSLETFEMIDVAATTNLLMKRKAPSNQQSDLEEARRQLLKRVGSSTLPLSNKDIEKLIRTVPETKDDNAESKSAGMEIKNSSAAAENGDYSRNNSVSNSSFSSPYFKCRRLDGRLGYDFSDKIDLSEAASTMSAFPSEEFPEENIDLSVAATVNVEPVASSSFNSGIIPVPASSRITPDVCKRNLARDIMLQQQQIDKYLDKIEGQIIRLSSQSRQSSTVTTVSASEMSSEREQMIQSLDLVATLSKTLIGDNDIVERPQSEDGELTDATMSDCSGSGWDSSSDSDDGDNNISNFSGTDTETADEGDNSGDDLLDI